MSEEYALLEEAARRGKQTPDGRFCVVIRGYRICVHRNPASGVLVAEITFKRDQPVSWYVQSKSVEGLVCSAIECVRVALAVHRNGGDFSADDV